MHIRKLLDNGRERVNQLYKVISNRNINLSARRHLLLSVISSCRVCIRMYVCVYICMYVCVCVYV